MPIVYVTTCLVNGKKYLGKHHSNAKWYLGSGKLFKKALLKYGKQNFERKIVFKCNTLEEAAKKEYELSILWNVVEDSNWYNLILGGIWGSNKGRKVSIETRKKLSEKLKGRHSWNSGLKGKNDPRCKHSEKWKQNHSNKLKGINYHNQGEKHSSSKEVIFTSPENNEYRVKGIRKFCRDNNLSFNIMIARLRGNKPELTTEKHPWKIKYA